MAKVALVIMMMTLVALMPWAQAHKDSWAKTTKSKSGESITHLQFYFHDNLSGVNQTAFPIAQIPNVTASSLTSFGLLIMADDPLTAGPEPTSKLVGRAQGLYGSASQTELNFIMCLDYGFVDGIYNGSSISVVGKNRVFNLPYREIAVVGGTGVFRLARGYAQARTYWFDLAARNAIVGYNVTIYH